jgi:hypothetical protein
MPSSEPIGQLNRLHGGLGIARPLRALDILAGQLVLQ